jgi:Kef-type K+ transport system membrane component KefB
MTPTATTGRILLDLAVVLVAARAGGALFERFGQPAVIGEIVAGVALGPTLLGVVPGDPSTALFPPEARTVLKVFGEVGLVLFMFTVGWDLDLRQVQGRAPAAAIVSIASVAVPFGLGLAVAAHLHSAHDAVGGVHVPFWPFALFVGAALSITAFPVLARILEETSLAGTGIGTLVLTAAAVDDVVGWITLAVALAVLASGGALDYVRIVLETAVFVAAIFLVVRPLLQRELRIASPARQALIVPLALVGAYVTDAIGIHAVFGAFLLGAAMPRPHGSVPRDELRRRLTPAVGLLVPIYFVTSGMAVDIPGLRGADIADFVLVLAAACAGKFLGAFGGARAMGVAVRDAAAVGILMNTRGLIEIVLLTVGRDRGLIDDRLFTVLAMMAIITTLLTPPLLRVIAPMAPDRVRGGPSWHPEVGSALARETKGSAPDAIRPVRRRAR